jgi:hypothetical protein
MNKMLEALEYVFSPFWGGLRRAEKRAVLEDFRELVEEFDGNYWAAAREYSDRIGGGRNIRSYAEVLLVQRRVQHSRKRKE